MASQGPNGPGSGTNVAPGPGNDVNGPWVSPGLITVHDGIAATQSGTSGSAISATWCQLTKNGTAAVGTNQISSPIALAGTETQYTIGGSSNLWGTTLSVAEVNASTFGVMYATQSAGGSATNWLVGTGFGFSIPAGATIDGVQVDVFAWTQTLGNSAVDYIQVTVYYTPAAGSIAVDDGGLCYQSRVRW